MKLKINFKWIVVLMIGLLVSSNLLAQQTQHIILLDAQTKLPIQGAFFQYGKQSGISNQGGEIAFSFDKTVIMKLSHLNYKNMEWDNEQLKNIMRRGFFLAEKISVHLYPITVIAVRSGHKPNVGMKLNYQDRLAYDAADLLNQTPVINSIRKSGNYGFDPVFRGFKYDQLNIVLNGAQSATAACPNRMDPPTSQMAPNMIDKIEVLKGPYALRYGTGFGATINFVTSKPVFSDNAEVYGRLSTGYESNGENVTGEGQLGFSGKVYNVSFFGAWAQGNDYESGSGQKFQSDIKRGSFGTNASFKLASNKQLSLSSIYNRARDVDFAALPMDLREDDTWMFNAKYDVDINNEFLKSLNTTLFASFVDHFMDNRLKQLNPRTLNAQTPAKTFNYGGRSEGFWKFSNGTLFAGADLRVEGAEGKRQRDFLLGPNAGKTVVDNAWQDSKISKIGAFGEYHLETEKYHFIFSGRMELNNAKVNDVSASFKQMYAQTNDTQFDPSLSLGMSRKINEHVTFGAWLGRAQRSAGLTERFINYFPVGNDPYEMLGNPNLSAEVNNQLDITVEWGTGQTALSFDVFGSYMENYISSRIDPNLTPSLPMSPGVRQYINIDDAFKTGFEINWTQKLFLGLQHQLGAAYTYAKDLEREDPLPEIAPLDFRYILRGKYLDDKLRPEVSFRHVLEQSRISKQYGETTTPSFSLLDVKILLQASNSIGIGLGVNNLFNSNYYEHLSRSVKGTSNAIFAPGRNMFASFNISF